VLDLGRGEHAPDVGLDGGQRQVAQLDVRARWNANQIRWCVEE
jgi:hypothetical protein